MTDLEVEKMPIDLADQIGIVGGEKSF